MMYQGSCSSKYEWELPKGYIDRNFSNPYKFTFQEWQQPKRAGLEDVTPHVLRHTAAVWMAENRVPMSEISQYLGHKSTLITERVYARYSPEYLRNAAQSLEIF